MTPKLDKLEELLRAIGTFYQITGNYSVTSGDLPAKQHEMWKGETTGKEQGGRL